MLSRRVPSGLYTFTTGAEPASVPTAKVPGVDSPIGGVTPGVFVGGSVGGDSGTLLSITDTPVPVSRPDTTRDPTGEPRPVSMFQPGASPVRARTWNAESGRP